MLQKGFFNVDPFNPKIIQLTEIYAKTTPGAYSYTVPDEYNYVLIEIAGAAGQQAYYQTGTYYGVPGRGAIKQKEYILTSRTISGVVGEQPLHSGASVQIGGTGYQNGGNGSESSGGGNYGGGGGGSSSVACNNELLTAGGGSGCGRRGSTGSTTNITSVSGGDGGGPNGGVAIDYHSVSIVTVIDGNDATDSDVSDYNSGGGYIKIWGGYNPYYN